jgi:ribonucleoside-diphosphate reductase alpha chain
LTNLKSLSDYVFVAKYAAYDAGKQRREAWHESIDRVRIMQLKKYEYAGIDEEINWSFDKVLNKHVLGSQRALQFGGLPMLKHHARCYNCTVSYCDRLRFFQEAMYLLLCGCGVGFSVQKHHINRLPKFTSVWNKVRYTESSNSAQFKLEKKIFVIPDNIEGWSDAIGVLLTSYFDVEEPLFPGYENCEVEFDYSKIRPKGSPLSSGIGKAPGPDGLRNSIEEIRKLLNKCIENGQDRLRPIDAYDIVMHESDAVLSGGVRRSATICLFSLDDEEMMNAKSPENLAKNPQRGRSNNSVVLLRGSTTKEQFMEIKELTKRNGEPGFLWTDDFELLVNPCVEIGFYAYDDNGNSGWAFCNLTEINGKKIKTKKDFLDACKASAIIGTLQAGYTNFPYLGKVTEDIVKKEALLGCSITGLMDSSEILLDPAIQRAGARVILKFNEYIAKKIGINPAARGTCIKPAGSTSLILGTASGIHPHHARRYLRRIQANKMEAPVNFLMTLNPKAIEESVYSINKTDYVITFCVEVPDGSKTKNQLSALELLEIVKSTKKNWVDYGKVESRCTKPWLSHNVSNTIHVQENEWDEVFDFIYKNRNNFAGISLLPVDADKDYQQAPNCTVYTPKEIVQKYGDASVFASGVIELGLEAFNGNLWEACSYALGMEVKNLEKRYSLKQAWRDKAYRFTNNYFDGDIKKMTYLLKDVYNWKLWTDLLNNWQDVDYTKMIELEDNTEPEQAAACSGGSCEI